MQQPTLETYVLQKLLDSARGFVVVVCRTLLLPVPPPDRCMDGPLLQYMLALCHVRWPGAQVQRCLHDCVASDGCFYAASQERLPRARSERLEDSAHVLFQDGGAGAEEATSYFQQAFATVVRHARVSFGVGDA